MSEQTSQNNFELGYDGPSVLVVGVDGTDTSWRALHYALGLARRQGSSVVAVFVAVPATGYAAAVGAETNAEISSELQAKITALAAEHRVQTSFIVESGDPVGVLKHVAETHRADAIVLGASEALGHRVFGSIAVRMVKHSGWPVTVVP